MNENKNKEQIMHIVFMVLFIVGFIMASDSPVCISLICYEEMYNDGFTLISLMGVIILLISCVFMYKY